MPEGIYRLIGGEGHGGECRCGCNNAPVVRGRVGAVARVAVARCEAPAIGAVTNIFVWVVNGMHPVDQGVVHVLLPVISVLVRQVARIETEERVVCKKERSAVIIPQRQGDSVIAVAVNDPPVACPPVVVDGGVDGVGGGGGGQNVDDQRLVVAPDLHVHIPVVIGRPVPVKHLLSATCKPVPLHSFPQQCDPVDQILFCRDARVEGLSNSEQSLDQEGSFDQVGAVVLLAERVGLAGAAIEPVGPGTVETVAGFEKLYHLFEVGGPLLPGDESAFYTGHNGHQPEPRSPGSDHLTGAVALACHPGDGVGKIVEIAEGLLLHEVEQCIVGELREFIG